MTARYPIVMNGGTLSELPSGDVLQAPAPTTAAASINLAPGVAPTAPVDGDAWTTSAGLFVRVNGATIGPLGAAGGGGSASLVAPQGRLTLVTGVPVMTGDQTAKSHVYYTPFVGAGVPIYDGSTWSLNTVGADLDMALDTSNQLINRVYDFFAWNNAGTLSIGAGPAWSQAATITVTIATPAVVSWTAHGLVEGDPVVFTTSGALPTGITAGTVYFVGRSPGANSFNISTTVANAAAGTFVATSGSQSGTHTATNGTRQRGTGAGTTELQLKNGIWTNKNSITLKNGAGAGTSGIAANTATFLGSAYMTANGQTGQVVYPATASGGSNNILALSNAYNTVPIRSFLRDSGSWTVTSATSQSLNQSTANRFTFLDCLGNAYTTASGRLYAQNTTGGNASFFGWYLNATNQNAIPDDIAQVTWATSAQGNAMSSAMSLPNLGLNYWQAVQRVSANTSTFSMSGFSGILEVNL
jgi:hypothetical protein